MIIFFQTMLVPGFVVSREEEKEQKMDNKEFLSYYLSMPMTTLSLPFARVLA